MDIQTIALVQDSFAKIRPMSETAGELFYADLFTSAPEVRPLFTGDINAQGMKLMATLGVVVRGLSDLGAILPVAEDLARKHVDYGVEPAHYDAVGASLLRTLEQGLGADFTPDVREAWVTAYAALSAVMISAAYATDEGEGA
ncbi:globin family protein [Celeribacter naphthalenivorans]|uniref:globin family protein n=1 Tax=Celeribacter naphthalenivorans TaxID=1614694 RepID=UPI001CFB0B63|nr:globin family protein [Celeribacter naphthalenivorans]